MIRKFTDAEYIALRDFCVASDSCRDLQNAAHALYHYRRDLQEHVLAFAFEDARQALEHLNKAFDAVRPLFPAEQVEAA